MISFADIMREHGVAMAPSGHRHSRENWIQIDCPWCGSHSNKFHLGYNLRGGYLNCWKCGRKDLINTLMAVTGKGFSFAKELLGEIPRERTTPKAHTGHLQNPRTIERKLPQAHRDYLTSRGFADVKALENLWEIRGTTQFCSSHPWRIFIPINHQGEQVSWTTRSIGHESKRRYISADPSQEKMSHKKVLYGEDYCRHACIITEGPLDVWAIGPGAVATLGSSYSRAQVQALARYSFRAVCFDSGAEDAARKLTSELMVFPGSTYNIKLETGDDPASADKEEIEAIRDLILAS